MTFTAFASTFMFSTVQWAEARTSRLPGVLGNPPAWGEAPHKHPYRHWGHCPSWPCGLAFPEWPVAAPMHRWLQASQRPQWKGSPILSQTRSQQAPQGPRGPDLSRVIGHKPGSMPAFTPTPPPPLTGAWKLHPGPRSARSYRTSPVAPR